MMFRTFYFWDPSKEELEMKKIVTLASMATLAFAGGAFADEIYSNDFEDNDGGWVATATWDPVGDFEWGDYDVACFVGVEGTAPPGANSGTKVWATNLCDDYTNSGGDNFLSQTFDLTGYVNTNLQVASWLEVFYSFDTARMLVNGDVLYERTVTDAGPWEILDFDLSAYDNMASVEIVFELHATTVVARAGWYIDDINIHADPDIACLELAVDNLVGGQQASFTVSGGTPAERGVVAWGTDDSHHSNFEDVKDWCATFGFNINMSGRKFRIIGSDIFDANGQFTVKRGVPEGASGTEVMFQAAEHNTCPAECMSKVATEVIG